VFPIRVGFIADPDPHPAFQVNADPGLDLGVSMTKNLKNLQLKKSATF